MAIITGLKTDTKKSERTRIITEFLNTELEIFTRIEDTYQLGAADPPAVVITFQSLQDKEAVFEKKAILKDVSANRRNKIYINHYVPPNENEKRKRDRKIVNDAKQEKLTTEYTKEGLRIGTSCYRKKVVPPDPTDLLNYSSEELDDLLKIQTMKGDEVRSKGSIYIPYAIDVADYQKIRDVYMKIRLLHAQATHIVCAFVLLGPEQEKHHLHDGCDDGESGAGAALLREMENSNITNKAFFIVRYCGDQKLGPARLKTYIEAAAALLKQKPMNKILQKKAVLHPGNAAVRRLQV